MKIKDIALSAAYVGQRVVKAIAVGAQEVWSAIKYIVFKDPVVEQICATNWGNGVGITEEQAAAVTDIGVIFAGNTEITSFDELENFTSLKALGDNGVYGGTFNGCTNLESVRVPEGVTSIGVYVFRNCSGLKKLHLPTTLLSTGDNSIAGCTALEEVNINDLVNLINLTGAFKDTTNLKTVNLILPKLKTLSAFNNSSISGEVRLPSLTSISSYALSNCKISKITDLGSITSIPGWALSNLPELVEAYIPSTVKTLGDGVFSKCTKLTTISNLNGNENITSLGGDCFADTPLQLHDFSLPNVTKIAGGTFRAAKFTGYVRFASLTSLGKNFKGTNIVRFEDLGKITSTPSEFLSSCNLLEYVKLPSTITSIGRYSLYACSKLNTVICEPTAPPTLGENSFAGAHADLAIYVPDQSVTAYRETSVWSAYADRIKPLSQYVES